MSDEAKSKKELIAELKSLRAELERTKANPSDLFPGVPDDCRTILDNLPQVVFELGTDGRFTYVNKLGLETFGYTQADLVNGVWAKETFPDREISRVNGNIKNILRGHGPYGEEYMAVRKDGSEFPIKIYSQPLFRDGEVVGIRGTVIDISDFREVEFALRQSENHYKALFDNTGTAMVLFDSQGIIIRCNDHFSRLCACPKEEIIGKMSWRDFVYDEDLPTMNQYHNHRNDDDGCAPTDYEFTFINRKGRKRRIHVFLQCLPDSMERVCSLIDITDRKQTEEALRLSEERYQLVVHGANDGIWDWDLESDKVYFSPRYKAILGYEDHEFPNMADSWKKHVHPDDLDYVIAANMECINGKVDQFEVEYRMLHKDGTYRWILGRGASAKNRKGVTYRLAGTHTDTTARKIQERTTLARYAISEAVSTTKDLPQLYKQIYAILDDLIGARNFYIALVDEKKDILHFPFWVDEKDDYYELCELSTTTKKGLTIHVLRTGEPLFISHADPNHKELENKIGYIGSSSKVWLGVPLKSKGKVIGVMAIQDYNNPLHYRRSDAALLEAASEQVALAIERKQSEEQLTQLNEQLEVKVCNRTAELEAKAIELERANKRLKELDKIKSALVSSISHELRTPLTSIRGFAKLAGKDFQRHFKSLTNDRCLTAKGDRLLRNLGIIENEGERLTRLINDFLDINRIESGMASWNDSFINPCETVQQAVFALSGAFESKPGISLIADLPDEVPTVYADPDKLQQILSNLLNNAWKFTRQGTVSVSISNTQDTVTICVSDTGPGISKEEQHSIFEKFHKTRIGDTISQEDKGTGLGLAICREIVEHYDGSIWVESTPGEGSTFCFTLPIARQQKVACTL